MSGRTRTPVITYTCSLHGAQDCIALGGGYEPSIKAWKWIVLACGCAFRAGEGDPQGFDARKVWFVKQEMQRRSAAAEAKRTAQTRRLLRRALNRAVDRMNKTAGQKRSRKTAARQGRRKASQGRS